MKLSTVHRMFSKDTGMYLPEEERKRTEKRHLRTEFTPGHWVDSASRKSAPGSLMAVRQCSAFKPSLATNLIKMKFSLLVTAVFLLFTIQDTLSKPGDDVVIGPLIPELHFISQRASGTHIALQCGINV